MRLQIDVELDYALDGGADILLQIEASGPPGQTFHDPVITTGPVDHFHRLPGEDGIGDRIWIRAEDRFSCTYSGLVDIERTVRAIEGLPQTPLTQLPNDAIRYLMASRYCPSDEFQTFVAADFSDVTGGALIGRMRDFINDRFSYVPGSSGPQTTALDTFVQRQGICRDFAHVMVTLARAAAIPARFVSCYAPNVTPPDFHAVAEVYLDGAWHLVDPTGMAAPHDIAVIGVGRDAADVAFMTIYGQATLNRQVVEVAEVS